jgi:hypothetical protein
MPGRMRVRYFPLAKQVGPAGKVITDTRITQQTLLLLPTVTLRSIIEGFAGVMHLVT